MIRWLRLAFAALVLAAAAPLTAAAALPPAYDASTIARVDLDQGGPSEASPARLSEARLQSASRTSQARGVSATPISRFVATEAASSSIDDILRPGGDLLGQAGSSSAIREVSGRTVGGSGGPNSDRSPIGKAHKRAGIGGG